MHSSLLFVAASGLALASAQGTTGKLGDAAIVQNNPAGVTYTAVLPSSNSTGIRGYVAGTSNSNGTGVNFNINLYGFPDASLGPFLYHIHDAPVPADGNCTGTLAHLDPYQRGEQPPCDATQPQTCQVGDLAGKHGKITSSPFQTTFLELYTSTASGPGSFFGNRSIVIHSANTTRLTCANFVATGGNTSVPTSNGTTGTSSGPSASPSSFKSSAAVSYVSFGAIAAGLAAFLL